MVSILTTIDSDAAARDLTTTNACETESALSAFLQIINQFETCLKREAI